MNKLFGSFLIVFLLSLAASYKFTGDAKYLEVWKTCHNNGTRTICPRSPIRQIICGSDGKSYSSPNLIPCLNKCSPENEKVTMESLGFCEPEYQKEYLERLRTLTENTSTKWIVKSL